MILPVFAGAGRVMIIKRENFILLIIPRNHIGRITVLAFVKLFEKSKTFRNSIVFSCVKIQIQPLRQFKKPFTSLAGCNCAVNRADNGNDAKDRKENKLHRKS